MNKFTKVVAAVIAAIVAGGWFYAFTSKNSDLANSFRDAGLGWNIAGIIWFFAGAYSIYNVASGKWGTGKDNRDVWLNIGLVVATVLGSMLIAAGFKFGA